MEDEDQQARYKMIRIRIQYCQPRTPRAAHTDRLSFPIFSPSKQKINKRLDLSDSSDRTSPEPGSERSEAAIRAGNEREGKSETEFREREV